MNPNNSTSSSCILSKIFFISFTESKVEIISPSFLLEEIVNNGDASYVIKKNGSRITLNYALYKKGTQVQYKDVIKRIAPNGKTKEFHIKDSDFKLIILRRYNYKKW